GPNETNPDDEKSTYSTPKKSDKEIISETIFYVFDQNGIFQSKNMFSGSDNFDVDFKQNGPHTVYVLCNVSEIIDLPATPSKEEIESLVIPHRTDYKRLPFAGKTEVDVLPSQTPQIKIKLNRINSAIKLENRSADRIDIEKMTVSGLPSMGYVFTPDEAVQGVTYNETAEAQTDADGNAVIYSFMVPKEKIAEVKLEADAKLKDETNPDADNIATVAPLSFLGSLEAGKRATALIGYLENGTLRVGSPENWGNVGKYQLTDDVLIQVIGGTFNDKGELRAYSGGSEFSFIIVSKSGEATLEPVSATDWIHLNDNVMTVDPNTTDSERRCRIAVKVGGQNVGIFTVVQGNAIKFTGEGDTTVEDDKVVVVGGKSTPAQVKFTISDAELAETEIVPVDNGENGVTVTVDRAAKSLTATLIAMVDASEVPEEGVSVPVNFVDINGSVQATITFVQRPARITFTTSNLTMPYSEDTHLVAVTTEGDAVWAVKSVTDASGNAISWLAATTDSKPAASGNNMTVTTQANSSVSSRTGYVRVESSYTLSKPLVVEQESTPNLSQPVDMGNGIEWMRVNLANPRQAAGGATFATKLPSQCTGVRAESHGKFYQWGVNVAWSSTG
ncbi:MAG: hypothetical protein K2N21_01120, partial [Rikenellaceae bacterium]|nr:hypothetical protein [Rikenellaceae bacterium]